MSQNNTNKACNGKLILVKGEWFYITSAPFCSIDGNENIVWKTLDANIVQINPNSGLIYAQNIGEATVIGVSANGVIRTMCVVQIQEVKGETMVIDTPRTMVSNVGGRSSLRDVSALGYSGTTFDYSELGNSVRLEKGWGLKSGMRNATSESFRCELIKMNNIYASMSPEQRGAWIELRVNGFLDTITSMLTSSPSEFLMDYLKDALVDYILPLDEIEALLRGFYPWYVAEQNAISYFQTF